MPTSAQTPPSDIGAEPPADVKPVVEDDKIHLAVRGTDASQVTFKVKKTARLNKLLTAYARKTGHDERGIRLTFDGERVGPEATAESLDLEDGDILDVVLQQVGGTDDIGF